MVPAADAAQIQALGHFQRALALQDAGQADRAAAAYRAGLAFAPGDAAALQNLGTALMAAGRAAEAITAWTRALHHQPAQLETIVSLSQTLLNDGQPERADAPS